MPVETARNIYFVVQSSCAGVRSLHVHRCNEGPLICLIVVTLRRFLPMISIISSHRVDQIVQNCHTNVTSSSVHGSNLSPHLGHRVETTTTVEIIDPVEPSDNVDIESNHCESMISSWTGWICFFDLENSRSHINNCYNSIEIIFIPILV